MNMLASIDGRTELSRQAAVCRRLGSPFVGAVLEAAQRQLAHAPMTERLIAGWAGDSAAAALAMRLNGALHALARRDTIPDLSALYRGEHDDFDRAIASAFRQSDSFLLQWMRDPTQTNEVGRSAAFVAALMTASRRFDLPFELFELGTSCGLNLNIDRYAYDLGGVTAGDPLSPVRIAPEWRGPPPPAAPVRVLDASGADLHPLNASDPAACERLLAFIWADQKTRADRLKSALAIARRHPPRIEEAEALAWIADKLAVPQAEGVCRVVLHSMFKQYLLPDRQHALTTTIERAGECATVDRPLAWLSMEWTPGRSEVQLCLTCWPMGTSRILATCHPYGEWVHWR